eukprot:1160480-Pelagomonas_calceolata.AAC.4
MPDITWYKVACMRPPCVPKCRQCVGHAARYFLCSWGLAAPPLRWGLHSLASNVWNVTNGCSWVVAELLGCSWVVTGAHSVEDASPQEGFYDQARAFIMLH